MRESVCLLRSDRRSDPVPADDAAFLMVRISSRCAGQPRWASAVDVYDRNGAAASVVGIERADP